MSSKLEWGVCRDTLSGTKALAYLRKAPPLDLVSSGSLAKFLATTKKAVCVNRDFTEEEATEAVTTGAVAVLAKLVGWLQQRPCREHHAAATKAGLHELSWYALLCTLTMVLRELPDDKEALQMECLKQLRQNTGMLYSHTATLGRVCCVICRNNSFACTCYSMHIGRVGGFLSRVGGLFKVISGSFGDLNPSLRQLQSKWHVTIMAAAVLWRGVIFMHGCKCHHHHRGLSADIAQRVIAPQKSGYYRLKFTPNTGALPTIFGGTQLNIPTNRYARRACT